MLYQAYIDARGPARISGYGSFTMVIAQFGHFWESAVRVFTSPNTTEEGKAHSLDRITELLDLPLRSNISKSCWIPSQRFTDYVAAVH